MKKRTALFQKGFTLIELLIVIALLGALAVGLLATIDPIEQLKKGRDTSLRNAVLESFNSAQRYYATKSQFPWGSGTTFTASTWNSLGASITELISAGELKSTFVSSIGTTNLAKIYVTSTASDHAAFCFQPESKGIQKDANTIYASSGVATTGCKSQTTGTAGANCNFCVQ